MEETYNYYHYEGGMIQQDDGSCLHAAFTSFVCHYIDDVEQRLNVDRGLIHIFSASHIGHSDFGVNRIALNLSHKLYKTLNRCI